jgi:hypothetical protein
MRRKRDRERIDE